MENFPFRIHFKNFIPYSSAREEFEGYAEILLDANESPFDNHGKNRYPDTRHAQLCEKIAGVKNQMFSRQLSGLDKPFQYGTSSLKITQKNIVLGNGSDELIDLIVRLFCEPKIDSLAFCSPTFGMYQVSADMYQINTIDIPLVSRSMSLSKGEGEENFFQLDTQKILEKAKDSKLLFLCNPNNPTGGNIKKTDIKKILQNFAGMVVVDEAYIEFCTQESVLSWLEKYPKLIVLQTFSKMWGLAGVRCGMAIGHPEVINKISALKAPYNVNILTAQAVNDALNDKEKIFQQRNTLVAERIELEKNLKNFPEVQKIFPSNSNFLLLKFKNNPEKIYNKFIQEGIIVRNFSKKKYLENCMRISIGTPKENKRVLEIMGRL